MDSQSLTGEDHATDSCNFCRIRCVGKDLKRRGFSFVGLTIVYAHMQAVGMVNDQLSIALLSGIRQTEDWISHLTKTVEMA